MKPLPPRSNVSRISSSASPVSCSPKFITWCHSASPGHILDGELHCTLGIRCWCTQAAKCSTVRANASVWQRVNNPAPLCVEKAFLGHRGDKELVSTVDQVSRRTREHREVTSQKNPNPVLLKQHADPEPKPPNGTQEGKGGQGMPSPWLRRCPWSHPSEGSTHRQVRPLLPIVSPYGSTSMMSEQTDCGMSS